MKTLVIFEERHANFFECEKIYLIKNRSQLVDVFDDNREVLYFNHYLNNKFSEARNYCNALAGLAFPAFCSFYEKKYLLRRDLRFYERILYPWLIQYVQAVYDRYLSIKSILEYDNSVVFVANSDNLHASFLLDVADYEEHASTDQQYNASFFSEIVIRLGYQRQTLQPEPVIMPLPEWKGEEWSLAKKTVNAVVNALAPLRALTGKGTHLLHNCYGCSGTLNILRAGRGRWGEIAPTVSLPVSQPDLEFRQQQLDLGSGEFERLLGAMLPANIPMGFCEYLPALIEWAKKQRLPKSGIVVTSVAQYTDLPLLVLSGVHNKPLAIIEHGCSGLHGLDDFHEKLQMHVADRYFSTGSTPYDLASAHLARKASPQKTARPLLVCSDGARYCSRIEYDVYSQPVWYHQQRLIFLKNLDKTVFPDVRLYFADRGYNASEGLVAKFPWVVLQKANNISIELAMAESCLTILDHVGTTLAKVMATNLPCMVFCTDMHLSSEAKSVVALMRRAKIWHDSPESAARFYSALVFDHNSDLHALKRHIQQWWKSDIVQDAKKAYCAHFARVSSDWEGEWRKAFDCLCADGVRSAPLF